MNGFGFFEWPLHVNGLKIKGFIDHFQVWGLSCFNVTTITLHGETCRSYQSTAAHLPSGGFRTGTLSLWSKKQMPWGGVQRANTSQLTQPHYLAPGTLSALSALFLLSLTPVNSFKTPLRAHSSSWEPFQHLYAELKGAFNMASWKHGCTSPSTL